MKKIFLVLFCLINLTGYSQQKDNPIIYLNDTEIDLDKVFVNPKSIDSVNVDKTYKS
jgi:hypothetical protein